MNILLWVLQVLATLLYGSSGVMKAFMFDKVSQDVPSFGALPREAWMPLGILELVQGVSRGSDQFSRCPGGQTNSQVNWDAPYSFNSSSHREDTHHISWP